MVCISPGPSNPANAGLCLEFLKLLPKETPVFGVCLGHQILGHFAGAPVVVADRIMHGKTSEVFHRETGLFDGLPNPMECCRYHSLLVLAAKEPEKLEITAWTEQNEVMGLTYRDRPWVGVQFHPESVFTPDGMSISVFNFSRSASMMRSTSTPGQRPICTLIYEGSCRRCP